MNQKNKRLVRCGLLKLKIAQQGAAIINVGYITHVGENVAAVHVDMTSKYCEVGCTGSQCDGEKKGVPLLLVDANERSIKLKKGKEKDSTEIHFPQFSGWDIWAANAARYSIYICFVRHEAPTRPTAVRSADGLHGPNVNRI